MKLPAHPFSCSQPSALMHTLRGTLFALTTATALTTAFAATELGNSAQQQARQRSQPAQGASATAAPAPTALAATPGRVVPTPLYGVTIDDISNLPGITQSLEKLAKKPTTRIVFDEEVPPSYYRNAAVAINKVSYVMGEILDSYYVNTVTVPGYLDRTRQYLSALGDVVDIWEIGNEINGEWLGSNADVVAKMNGAYDLTKAQGKTAALTLYYNQDCWERPANEMFTWANANVPYRMKQGLDYVFISYYEEDCNNLKPDWQAVFTRLSAMFPNSKIGFGEIGTSRKLKKPDYLTR
ncbi:MAG: rane protein, partial [Polaromonas sp.]|nr:rane protein [Polaromonas sp.]